VAEVLAEGQALGERCDPIILRLVPQGADLTVLDVDVLGPQVVEDDRKERRIAVNEDGIVLVPQARDASAEQGREKGVRDPRKRLPRRGKATEGKMEIACVINVVSKGSASSLFLPLTTHIEVDQVAAGGVREVGHGSPMIR